MVHVEPVVNITVVKSGQLVNELTAKLVTVVGIVRIVKFGYDCNVVLMIDVTVFASVKLVMPKFDTVVALNPIAVNWVDV